MIFIVFPCSKSLRRGWEMFAISLALFPPSIRFRGYLEGYVWRHVEPSPAFKGVSTVPTTD